MVLKAFQVFHRHEIDECVLVFAETANKARSKATIGGPYDWYYEYIELRANREPKWDEYAKEKRIIELNEDLPEGAPAFYCEDCYV